MAKGTVKSYIGIGVAAAILAIIFVPLSDSTNVFGAKGHANNSMIQTALLSSQSNNNAENSNDLIIEKHVKNIIARQNQENGPKTDGHGKNNAASQQDDNLLYVMTAKGIANSKSKSDSPYSYSYSYSSVSTEAKFQLILLKSIHGLTVLKITGGSFKMGDETLLVNSGYVTFRQNAHKLTAFAFVSNDSQGHDSHPQILIKLQGNTDSALPNTELDPGMIFKVLSPQSKIVPGIFLAMDGKITLAN